MKKKLGVLGLVLILVLGAALVGWALWYTTSHVFIGGEVYDRDVQLLDYREEKITPDYYDQLRKTFPNARILWNVPFQGYFQPNDIRELTIRSLTESDMDQLQYFENLQTLDARGCSDYDLLESLRERYPQLQVHYTIPIGGKEWSWDADTLLVERISEADAKLLRYFPRLRRLDARGCRAYDLLEQIRRSWPNLWVEYTVDIGGNEYPTDTDTLYLTGVGVGELAKNLAYLPQVKTVGVQDPVADGGTMTDLQEQYPRIDFSWETAIQGITVTSTQTELDLTGVENPDLEILEQKLSHYPLLETVILGPCGVDNEELAAFREKMREEYKVVWTVQIGEMAVRTDETTFMPTKFGLELVEEDAYNLRYCEDMICVDVGHKEIITCQWAAYMPHLKYLILADTRVSDLTPLTGLKELIYLEIFITPVIDYSPLLTCTALEDLNISYTHGNYQVLYQMTWLKRLWWAGSYLSSTLAQEKLPNTELMFNRISSTGLGWREGQNYYDMRELLGMSVMFG